MFLGELVSSNHNLEEAIVMTESLPMPIGLWYPQTKVMVGFEMPFKLLCEMGSYMTRSG